MKILNFSSMYSEHDQDGEKTGTFLRHEIVTKRHSTGNDRLLLNGIAMTKEDALRLAEQLKFACTSLPD